MQFDTSHLPKPVARRFLGRYFRSLTRYGEGTAETISKECSISRATFYNVIAELERWEDKQSPGDEATELAMLWPDYRSDVWVLASGRMLLAYAKDMLDPDVELIITRRKAPVEDIGVNDPLCD